VLSGVFYNGSFDTPYERIPDTLARLEVVNLTTVTYLDELETNGFANLQYLSYPRGVTVSSDHFYLAHEIHAQPDYDHVVHGVFKDCKYKSQPVTDLSAYAPPGSLTLTSFPHRHSGASWSFPGRGNLLEDRLFPGEVVKAQLLGPQSVECLLAVQEGIHCMVGPGFMDNC
jgi:hypothetical protein